MEKTSRRFPPPRWQFVPEALDAGDWAQVEPIFALLESRPIGTVEELEAWLGDVSELEARLYAEEARRYIGMTCHTDDGEKKERFLQFTREIDPRIKVAFDRLDRKYLESPARAALERPRYDVLDRIKQSDVDLFNEQNVEIEARESELTTKYTEIAGSLSVELDGKDVTLAQAFLELEEPDRARREHVWRRIAERRYRECDAIEGIFGDLLALRQQLARNAGFANYRDFRFKKLHRFDYGVEECEEFHAAVRDVVVPCVTKMNTERRERLGIEALRPWDFDVDPYSAAPFRPFGSEQELGDLASTIFGRVDGEFAEDFAELRDLGLLDLYSRPHKAPGGYQYFLEDVRLPFIFANAAGTHDDVQVLLHEGGHAFHSLLCRDEPILRYRDPPIEFCEVASMGMEFLGLEHVGEVYPQVQASRVRRNHLERTLRLFTWIATVDAFQHAIYTMDECDAAARRREWTRLRSVYAPDTDWSGLERFHEVGWHRQGHLFRQPFYYIEYGIAQIGALQLWQQAQRDPAATVRHYRRALALGGSAPLPELFAAGGLRFEFGAPLLGELVEETFAEWERLLEEEKSRSAG